MENKTLNVKLKDGSVTPPLGKKKKKKKTRVTRIVQNIMGWAHHPNER